MPYSPLSFHSEEVGARSGQTQMFDSFRFQTRFSPRPFLQLQVISPASDTLHQNLDFAHLNPYPEHHKRTASLGLWDYHLQLC